MNTPETSHKDPIPRWLELVEAQVTSLHFGSVQLVVQDSQVVEIETTEKVRFDKPVQSGARKR